MASKKMEAHAKGWKSPAERRDEKRAENMKSECEAGKIAARAPKDSTGRRGKDTPDSKGPTVNAWTKGNKPPKGC